MTNEELEKRIAAQERSLDALLNLAADNETKIGRLTADVQSLAGSTQIMAESIRTITAVVAQNQAQIAQTQTQLQGLIATVDRFIQGRSPNGGGPQLAIVRGYRKLFCEARGRHAWINSIPRSDT